MTPKGRGRRAEIRRCTEALRELMLCFRARVEEELRETGVTLSQLRMLKVVQEQSEGVSAATIARLCLITPQTLQTMLARATREGWIVRGTSEANHRFVTATLTAEGEAILQRGIEMKERMEMEAWGEMPVEALTAMRQTLEAGLENLKARAPKS